MPIVNLQRQLRELGRIRTGNQVSSEGGRKRPNKLETLRFTSERKELIEAVAGLWGGVATPWSPVPDRHEWEVITSTASVPIVVPPGQPVSQWMEMWTGGGCVRRCDGVREMLGDTDCLCPSNVDERIKLAGKGQACKPTTRLNVLLPDIGDIGVWRLESHGFYAAVELAGAAEILAMATERGSLIPATLRLEQREKKVPGQPTNRYAVPIIELLDVRLSDLQIVAMLGAGSPAQLTGGQAKPKALEPGHPHVDPPASSDLRAPDPAKARPVEVTDDSARTTITSVQGAEDAEAAAMGAPQPVAAAEAKPKPPAKPKPAAQPATVAPQAATKPVAPQVSAPAAPAAAQADAPVEAEYREAPPEESDAAAAEALEDVRAAAQAAAVEAPSEPATEAPSLELEAAAVAPAATPRETADARAAEVAGNAEASPIDHAALKQALTEMGVGMAYAAERSKRLYPRGDREPLTDPQRAGLLAVLRDEAGGDAL